jgi:ATP-dependent HslUV protease ATP-binding subunit HslU
VLERLLESVSFQAGSGEITTLLVDAAYVDQQLGTLVQDEDLARYIL